MIQHPIRLQKAPSVRTRSISWLILLLSMSGMLGMQSCAPSMRFTTRQMGTYTPPSTASRVQRSPLITLPVHPPAPPVEHEEANFLEGMASYYGDEFQGRLTSNGEVFDQSLLTAAHRSLPFGTVLKVTNMRNGRSVVVRVNDRGPFAPGRILDLSRGAAERIDMLRDGVARVSIAVLN